MFQKALAIAAGFTLPVVLSRQAVSGACSSIIGTYVVVNREGWFVTAYHILELIDKLNEETVAVTDFETKQAAINADNTLDIRERRRRVNKLKRPTQETTKRWAVWWGRDGIQAKQCSGIQAVDIGVGKLEPFDPGWFPNYPVFKDPTKNFEPGRSLCKLGFPFHTITPTYDAIGDVFRFPPGALPMPRFPIDGIFTRIANLEVVGAPALPYPLQWLETSSPGLRGQSGGPTVDEHGNIWAIQSRTDHLPLGFDPPVPGNPKLHEHQFLNVGRGVHAATILGLFRDLGIDHEISAD
jgi:hypothetical protein